MIENIGHGILSNIDLNRLLINGIFAILILIIGVFLGKLVSYGLKKFSKKAELDKKIRGSFIDLFIIVIRWSIYLLFINFGLNQLEIPALTKAFTNIILVIPAFTGALLILILGIVVAVYLREIIEDTEAEGWQMMSKIVFYFIIYIFIIYAIKIALIPLDNYTVNMIILILTAVIGSGLAYVISKKEIKNSQ
jgi:hypothetical protein